MNEQAIDRWICFIAGNLETLTSGLPELPGHFGLAPVVDPDRATVTPGIFHSGVGNAFDLVESIERNTDLYRGEVERGIIEWSKTWKQPAFEGDAEFAFLFRLSTAGTFLDGCKDGRFGEILSRGPDPADDRAILAWLLIDLWNELGESAIRAFVKTHTGVDCSRR